MTRFGSRGDVNGFLMSLERRDHEIRGEAKTNAEDAKDAKGRGGRTGFGAIAISGDC